jgi:hypothetical protein
MLAPELTLEAALRDVGSRKHEFRYHAAENLARALLHALGQPGPRWHAAAEHPRGPEVLDALRRLCDEREPAVLRGTAAVGLSMLGEPEVLEHTAAWLELPDDDEDQAFLRESAIMAAARLHRAAAQADADPELRQRIGARVEAALHAPAADLRYQGALALVELRGDEAEGALVDALRREEHPAVREGLVEALAHLDPAGPSACDALEQLLAGPEGEQTIGLEAALVLAAARRSSARPRLLQALPVRGHRDRALEGLAALGTAPPADVEIVLRLSQRWWLPAITRVRVAYALARMAAGPGAPAGDDPGLRLLGRLRWHPRPAVREAVRDAHAALETLAARERA